MRSSLALLLVAGVAHADPVPQPKQAPEDLFGLKKDAQAALDCGDGREFGCATATDPFADRVPYALDQWLPASYLLSLPIADATQDQVASFALGVGRDEAGVTCGGSNGLENRWLIDGAPADDLRTGAVGTRVPVTFIDGLWVTVGGFAASVVTMSFSPDSTYIYYLEDQTYSATLNRVSKFGGGQRKIADEVSTRPSFSPDGTHMVFARVHKMGEPADLVIASPDGDAQRVLAKRTLGDQAFFFSDRRGPGPVWSPNGQSIACATHGTGPAPSANIELVDPQTGASRRVTAKPWTDLSRLTWLADGSGLVAAVKETAKTPWQIQLVSLPGGETRAVTNDPNNYTAITGAADSTSFVTINAEEESNVWLFDFTGPGTSRKINNQNGITEVFWNHNGALTFVARDATNSHLWTEDINGTSLRQLTFEKADQFNPAVSENQRSIFFVSGGPAGTSIFRVDADGSNAKQLTTGPSDTMPSIAPDGTWLAYRTAQGIRKLSLDDGSVTSLWDAQQSFNPAISPNGRLLSFFTSDQADSKKWSLVVLDVRTASAVARFELPETTDPFGTLRWTRTGDGLTYISSAGGAANVWLQPMNGGQPRQVTDFGSESELYSFAWSPDGKKIACVRHAKVFVPMLVRLY